MVRIFFLYIMPLLLPTVIYMAWIRQQIQKNKDFRYKAVPLPILLIIGIMVIAVILGAFMLDERSSPDATYSRAQFKDGVLIPAKLEEK